jgi:hypothetical protein
VSRTSECAFCREESKIGRQRATKTSNVSSSAAYRTIGNAYRAPNRFVILQRTNTALAVTAYETAPVRVDCSALHRALLAHVGGFT